MDVIPGDCLVLTASAPSWERPRTFEIGPPGGWIGRDRGCEVAIDDPDQFVSARHARIDYAKGAFWLTDQSTNGTFLNGSVSPMETGERHRLGEGNTIRVGLCDMAVALRRSPAEAAAARPESGASPLGWTGASQPMAPSPQGDPLAALISDLVGEGHAPAPPPRMEDAGWRPAAGRTADLGWSTAQPAPAPEPPVQPTVARPSFGGPGPDDGAAHAAAEAAPASWAAEPEPAPPREAVMQNTRTMPTAPAMMMSSDLSMEALAAFWHGLGILPRSLRPDDLVAIMGEFGAALREAADNFANVLRTTGGDTGPAHNPFSGGHGSLRRYLNGRSDTGLMLDEAVREVFLRIAERDQAYGDAVRSGVRHVIQNLAPSAIEKRFGATVQSRWQRSRRAELWRLFSAMENDLADLAEATFQRELGERLRASTPRAAARGTGREGS